MTLAAYGPMVKVCLEAAAAAAEEGRDLEVAGPALDVARSTSTPSRPRWRRPAGWSSCTRPRSSCGTGAEIAARITERCFYHLEAPVLRVGGFHAPYPPARVEEDYLPGLDRVLDAVDRALAF